MPPQDAHAGGLLLGLLGLLLLAQHLLVQDQLDVLLSEVKRILNQVQGPVWKIQHHLVAIKQLSSLFMGGCQGTGGIF